MHYVAIAGEIEEREYRSSLGATPANTVASLISLSLKDDGDQSPFERIGKGEFRLRGAGQNTTSDVFEEEETSRVIAAFGVYWNRADVDWSPTKPKLLGQESEASVVVDFTDQIGIYLLYDGRDVIYIGQSNEGRKHSSIGSRLRAHTRNRLKARWDRFSWFGLYPIEPNPRLQTAKVVPEKKMADAKAIVDVLEATLIEAMEPSQNRRQGEYFSGIEYLQFVDPKVQKSRLIQMIESN